MKIVTSVLLMVVIIMAGCSNKQANVTAQQTYDRGVREVTNGNLEVGYKTLLSLHDQGFRSGYLYYNLAVTAYKMDSISVAKYYYLMSRSYAETYELSNQALTFVDSRFANKAPGLPALPWEKFFDYLDRTLGSTLLFILAVLGMNLFVLLHLTTSKRITQTWWNYLYKSIAVISLIALICAFYIDYRNNRYDEAVMITGQHALKEVPDLNARVLAQTYEGYQFTVDRQASKPQEGWWYVRMSNGIYGWLPLGSIRVIHH
jgi:hypothetical protein